MKIQIQTQKQIQKKLQMVHRDGFKGDIQSQWKKAFLVAGFFLPPSHLTEIQIDAKVGPKGAKDEVKRLKRHLRLLVVNNIDT